MAGLAGGSQAWGKWDVDCWRVVAGFELVVTEDHLGNAVADRGVGLVDTALGFSGTVEEEDEGPGLRCVCGVIWREGDIMFVAEGGVGFPLVEVFEGDVGCGGVRVAGILGRSLGVVVEVGHYDVLRDVLGASFRRVEGVKSVWVDLGVFPDEFACMLGWRHIDIRAEQGNSDGRAESHVQSRSFTA